MEYQGQGRASRFPLGHKGSDWKLEVSQESIPAFESISNFQIDTGENS